MSNVGQPVDFVQLLHNHVGGDWEDLPPAAAGMHTLRLLLRGVEVGRATAKRKVWAKKLIAYRYLRDNNLTNVRDEELDAVLRAQT
ncbi:hypothetical protein MD484_g4876, partial [Candolleomyces efflorescens]